MSWSDIFLPSSAQTYDEAKANLARQKAQYQAALDRRVEEGTIAPDVAARNQAYVDNVALEDQDAAAAAGFQEGASQGFNNVKDFFSKAFGLIPWQAWVIGAVVLFLYL